MPLKSRRGYAGRHVTYVGYVLSIVCCMVLMPCTTIAAQVTEAVPSSSSSSILLQAEELTGRTFPLSQRRIGLAIENETVHSALRRLAEQAGRAILYDTSDPKFSQLISVHVSTKNVGDAFAAVLKGTGLIAAVGPDGETIVVQHAGASAYAQRKTGVIIGRVVDSTGRNGIRGVTVNIIGTKAGFVTREDGAFRIGDLPPGTYTISAKRLEYTARTVAVTVDTGMTDLIVISLQSSATPLSEVVTTATGSQRRVEVANDVARINADSLMRTAPIRSVTDLLTAARVPGVEVTPSSGLPGAPSRIRLRGVGSISRNNDPVVIVNGIWINAATSTKDVLNRAVGAGVTYNEYVPSRLDDIDPSSIETIEILRGPSAAALYGTEAANGVIVITTKRGNPNATRWSVGITNDWDKVPGKKQPVYRGYGEDPYYEGVAGICNIESVLNAYCVQDSVSTFNPLNSPLLTNEAASRSTGYTADVSGGAATLQYNFTASYRDQLGPVKLPVYDQVRIRLLGEPVPGWLKRPAGLEATSISTRLTAQPAKSLDLGFTIAATQTNVRNAQASSGINPDALNDTILSSTVPTLYQTSQSRSEATTGILGATADWLGWAWLLPNVTAGLERTSRSDDATVAMRVCGGRVGGCPLPLNSLGFAKIDQSVYTLGARSTFPLLFKRWERYLSVRPSLGMNVRKNIEAVVTTNGDSLPVGSTNISEALQLKSTQQSVTSGVGGWYIDATIGVLQRFFTTVGFRRDVGSALSRRISTPTYPKIGTSWLISDEPFFPKNRVMPTLRLRAAYGHSAVQPDISAITGAYVNAVSVIGGQVLNGPRLTGVGNFRLKPERSVELEYGFDADLFANRVQTNLTIATKRNRDELVTTTLPPSAGVSVAYTQNIARVYNRSVEWGVEGRLIDQQNMLWTARLSGSTLLNRVERLGEQFLAINGTAARIVEGYPIFGLWARPVISYNDVNGDGLLERREIVIGDSAEYFGWQHPRYTLNYGTTLGLLHGRINLTANFAYDAQLTQMGAYDGWGSQDIHAPLSQQASAQLVASKIPIGQTISVLRFNNASASVTLPNRWTRLLHAHGAVLSLSGSNLGLWTKYRGRDPGVNVNLDSEVSLDNGVVLPQPRTYALAVRLNF